tara:strand:- start:2977 stop:4377 length:1401 start_codon:yes stop_codon:yes gene_type:complete
MAIGNPITLTSNVASKTINVIATASQSLFTVNGGYRINEIAVFRNGVRLVDGRDFTARDGATVTLLSAATEGDALEFQVFDTFRVADAITPFDSDQTIAGNLNITGILSASQLGSVNFNVTSGIQTFNDVRVGGALTVAGVLTFDDVTNVDSVGYATFRSGINAQGAGSTTTTLNVTGVSTFAGDVSIADKIIHTGDTNTSIRFPAADTFTVETAGSERLRVTGANLLVGTNAARSNLNDSSIETRIQIEAAGDNDSAALSIISNAGTTNSEKRSGLLVLGRTRGTSNGATTVVVEDDQVGMIEFKGMDGTSFTTAASIKAQVDGSVGTDDMPGRLVFLTSADGSAIPTERLRITSAGDVGIGTAIPRNISNFGSFAINGTSGAFADYVLNGTRTGTVAVDSNGFSCEAVGSTTPFRIITASSERVRVDVGGNVNITGITTANQLFEGTTRVATTGKAIAMAMLFG